jgi:transcriptional regulator with XRE-family HTH domain
MAKRPLKAWDDVRQELMQDPEMVKAYREVANEVIGEALCAVREARGLSQREVAERMGVTRSRVSQIEGAEGTALALEVLRRYAQAVGCRLELSLKDSASGVEVARLYLAEAPVSAEADSHQPIS